MKSTEQIIKALEYRLTKLEENMSQLEPKIEDNPNIGLIYQSSYERHNELSALLTFIKNEGCGTSACGRCETPCSSKNG